VGKCPGTRARDEFWGAKDPRLLCCCCCWLVVKSLSGIDGVGVAGRHRTRHLEEILMGALAPGSVPATPRWTIRNLPHPCMVPRVGGTSA